MSHIPSWSSLTSAVGAALGHTRDDAGVPVTIDNFTRAETDTYFTKLARGGGFGQLRHRRQHTAIDEQDVVRMNRDTLYSSGVFDLDAGPVTLTLADAGPRYQAVLAIDEDHYVHDVVYPPGKRTFTREGVGTRYFVLIVRTLANADDPLDIEAANRAQDAVVVEQPGGPGQLEVPSWDTRSLSKIREALKVLAASSPTSPKTFGKRSEVDPVRFLLGTAAGWGGNPPSAAIYKGITPRHNDGKVAHILNVKDVPVDGFWSITVYNREGFIEKSSLGVYSLNNLTARSADDGSFTVHFGGCSRGTPNCLPIMSGWNYTVRLYRPRSEILDGRWTFPEAVPVH